MKERKKDNCIMLFLQNVVFARKPVCAKTKIFESLRGE
jgi:hypothetical protein